jgi:predicted Zn-dependent protease
MRITKWISIFMVVSFLSCQKLTDVVRPLFLSDSEEIALGNKFKAQILADPTHYPPFKGDDRVKLYVSNLGASIASVQKDWNPGGLQFTFTIIEDSAVNAFAVPGGHVFVYTGLLKAAGSKAQVAGVLAHEIAHITKHHSANLMVQQSMFDLTQQILFGSDTTSSRIITSLLGNLTFLKFSRDDENQADSCSVVYTARANINPLGIAEFLGILKNKYGDNARILEPITEPLSTHPPLSKRIEHVNEIIQKTPGANTSLDPGIQEYALIKSLINK